MQLAPHGHSHKTLLTMLYRSTDCLCRCGVPMANLARCASFDSHENDAPSKYGIKTSNVFSCIDLCSHLTSGLAQQLALTQKPAGSIAPLRVVFSPFQTPSLFQPKA
jgi:hypothetical protein